MRRPFALLLFPSLLLGGGCDRDLRGPALDRTRDGGLPDSKGEVFDAEVESRRLSGPAASHAVELAPISGGTLLVMRGGESAIVADPDRDLISVVDLTRARLLRQIAVSRGDAPGRSIELSPQRVVTVLRDAGALAVFDPAVGEVVRVPVCGAPRGVAHDAEIDVTYVSCMTGELVTLGDGATHVLSRRHVAVDLRDLWIEGDELRITRFRSAEVLATDRAGEVLSRSTPPSLPLPRAALAPDGGGLSGRFSPTVAWRATALPSGGAVLVHQRAIDEPVQPQPGGYGASGNECNGGIVQSVLTLVDANGNVRAGPSLVGGVLPVDVAVSPDESTFAVALAGSLEARGVQIIRRAVLSSAPPESCAPMVSSVVPSTDNEPVAVGFDARSRPIVQYRDPSILRVGATEIALDPRRASDTGHLVFHMNAGAGIACASCHPEGGEDGHVWQFAGIGPRRTQSLAGGLVGTEPFHWNGDMADLTTLTHEVFSSRMGGPRLRDDQIAALTHWLDRIPLPASPPAWDAAAVARGRALFARTDVGCESCHGGARLQRLGSADVGTGGPLEIPSLRGVVYRTPLLHSGCAPNLAARFSECGGGDQHGSTSQLSAGELADLVAYLETL